MPPWRGAWGCPPTKPKKGASCHPLQPRHEWGPKRCKPSAYGGGQRGWRGRSPLPGGLGDVPPKTKIGGEQPTLATPPRVGPKTLANPQPTGVGKRGWRGRSPLPGGLGDVPPKFSSQGASRHPLQPRHEWDQSRWQTLSQRGWGKIGKRR